MERHLAALEALNSHTGPRSLALAAASAGLAHARADATADAHALLARTRLVGDLVEFHRSVLLFRVVNCALFRVANHAYQVLHLADHAAGCRSIRQIARPADFVETEPDQRRTLIVVAPLRAAHLLDLDRLLGLGHALNSSISRSFGIAFAAARLQGGHLDIAAGGNRARRILVLERIEGCPHHVVWIG